MERKLKKTSAAILFIIILVSGNIFAQEVSLCQVLGKNVRTVIQKFGRPLHHDKSNPTMECVYYQTKSSRLAFIANKKGVYQIQADYYYTSKGTADKAMDSFLSKCGTKDMVVDTVSSGDYKIAGSGVRIELTLFENTYSKKYEVKIKASQSEDK